MRHRGSVRRPRKIDFSLYTGTLGDILLWGGVHRVSSALMVPLPFKRRHVLVADGLLHGSHVFSSEKAMQDQREQCLCRGSKIRWPPCLPLRGKDLIAVNMYNKHSVGPSIRSIWTRSCFTLTNMIQVCSNFPSIYHTFSSGRDLGWQGPRV